MQAFVVPSHRPCQVDVFAYHLNIHPLDHVVQTPGKHESRVTVYPHDSKNDHVLQGTIMKRFVGGVGKGEGGW